MTVWDPECGHSWCVRHGVQWGMHTDWGDRRVSRMVEQAARLAALGNPGRTVLDWIYSEMAKMAQDEQGEVFDPQVRAAIAAALDLVWMVEYADTLPPASGLATVAPQQPV